MTIAMQISIITTYNGQKELISDVLKQRCPKDMPARVSTVDKYQVSNPAPNLPKFCVGNTFHYTLAIISHTCIQGQQNDYILLSLVRTKTVGHVRDVRRLVVAMSRARLGLYVFCRKTLFESCYELANVFQFLLKVLRETFARDEHSCCSCILSCGPALLRSWWFVSVSFFRSCVGDCENRSRCL